MAKNDKRKQPSEPPMRAESQVSVPEDIMSLLSEIANREPEVVKISGDARADVLTACASVAGDIAIALSNTLERIAQCSVEAPNHPISYDQG